MAMRIDWIHSQLCLITSTLSSSHLCLILSFLTLIRWDGLTPIDRYPGLSKIMHSLKGRTARERNLIIGRTGSFWEHESFDHVIRQGKFDKTILYVLNNPVKAGLVDYWEDWRWNYCRGEILDRFRKK